MAQVAKNVQNNFIAGLKTEYTGLNFPDNAATDTSNCTYSLIGDVSRRGGIDLETNGTNAGITTANVAINSYKWNNVGGDGQTQMVVVQAGASIHFYLSSAAIISSPLSRHRLSSQTVSLNSFVASGGSLDSTVECQFADGNGYLFVFHPSCDPFYCTFNSGNNTITANLINIQIRDFIGIPEPGIPVNFRPSALTNEHKYNLENQGWTAVPAWSATSNTTNDTNVGSHTWTVQVGLTISNGQLVSFNGTGGISHFQGTVFLAGVVTAYNSGTGALTLTVNSSSQQGLSLNNWTFNSSGTSTIDTWHTAEGNYPSNSDVWWVFKTSAGVFNVAGIQTTAPNVTFNVGQAPQGHFILNAFNQDRTNISGVSGLTTVSTVVRPRTGCWFQGRVFYAGIDGSQQATGDAQYYTWTENIYFSQTVTGITDFGTCYQTNDPSSENFFDLLPTDGGVIVIQGSGSIYKLFPVQNGLLVFAANGIWFISGSTGIGFAANDYTITKISGIHSISGTSFVNVLGWPYFWNHEGIYRVGPTQTTGGGERGLSLGEENLTLGNILSFYQDIPLSSKLYVHGDYDPINYQLQWCYRSTTEAGISNRYTYDSILVHNTVELPREARGGMLGKVFYPYTVDTTVANILGVIFVQNPSVGSSVPDPVFKYLTTGFTFSEENNFSTFADWLTVNGIGVDAAAHVITGYNLKPQHHPYYQYYAQALVKHSVSYINVFIRNSSNNSYIFNSIWDWAISGDSGKFSSEQQVTNNLTSAKYKFLTRRHRVRGRGYSVQFKFQSVPGQPMDLIGWSVFESVQEAP